MEDHLTTTSSVHTLRAQVRQAEIANHRLRTWIDELKRQLRSAAQTPSGLVVLRNRLPGLVVVLAAPCLAYVITLVAVPIDLSVAARSGLSVVVLHLGLLLYLAFNLPGRTGALAGLAMTLAAFALPLAGLWSGTVRAGNAIGGLIPWNDANGYYLNAQRLLEGFSFGSSNFGSRWLFPGLLASLMGLTGQNLQVTLAILVAITAISCFLLAREVQFSHGTAAGVTTLLLSFLFYQPFSGETMTEALGLAMGAIGLAVLWRGAYRRRIGIVWVGMFLLTLALYARPGALLVLPALIAAGAWAFRGRSWISLPFVIGGVSAVGLGVLVNRGMLQVLAPDAMAFNNFSYTLYGVAVGGKGWKQAWVDYPQLADVADAPELARRIYALAFDKIRADPQPMLRFMWDRWRAYLQPWTTRAYSFFDVRHDIPLIPLHALLYDVAIVGWVACWVRRREPAHAFLAAGALGIVASVPLLTDGGLRVYAATIPISALLVGVGVSLIIEKVKRCAPSRPPPDTLWPHASVVFGLCLAALVVAGPLVTKALSHRPQLAEAPCPDGQDVAYVRVARGSAIHIVGDSTISQARVPQVRLGDFLSTMVRDAPPRLAEEISQAGPCTTMLSPLNLKDGSPVYYLLADTRMMPKQPGIIRACGKYSTQTGLFHADSIHTAAEIKK